MQHTSASRLMPHGTQCACKKRLCPHKVHLLTNAKEMVYQLWVVEQVPGADTQIPTAQRVAHCVEMSHEVLHDNGLMKIKSNSFVWPLFFIQSAGSAQAATERIKPFFLGTMTEDTEWQGSLFSILHPLSLLCPCYILVHILWYVL